MRAAIIGAGSGLMGVAGGEAGTSGITQALLALLGGGVLSLVVQHILNRRKDGVQLSSDAIRLVRESVKAVAEVREDLDEITAELERVQAKLRAAEDEIADLKRQLAERRKDREELSMMLMDARRRESTLRGQIEALQARMAEHDATLSGERPDPPETPDVS